MCNATADTNWSQPKQQAGYMHAVAGDRVWCGPKQINLALRDTGTVSMHLGMFQYIAVLQDCFTAW